MVATPAPAPEQNGPGRRADSASGVAPPPRHRQQPIHRSARRVGGARVRRAAAAAERHNADRHHTAGPPEPDQACMHQQLLPPSCSRQTREHGLRLPTSADTARCDDQPRAPSLLAESRNPGRESSQAPDEACEEDPAGPPKSRRPSCCKRSAYPEPIAETGEPQERRPSRPSHQCCARRRADAEPMARAAASSATAAAETPYPDARRPPCISGKRAPGSRGRRLFRDDAPPRGAEAFIKLAPGEFARALLAMPLTLGASARERLGLPRR